jgi:hypothetical protein
MDLVEARVRPQAIRSRQGLPGRHPVHRLPRSGRRIDEADWAAVERHLAACQSPRDEVEGLLRPRRSGWERGRGNTAARLASPRPRRDRHHSAGACGSLLTCEGRSGAVAEVRSGTHGGRGRGAGRDLARNGSLAVTEYRALKMPGRWRPASPRRGSGPAAPQPAGEQEASSPPRIPASGGYHFPAVGHEGDTSSPGLTRRCSSCIQRRAPSADGSRAVRAGSPRTATPADSSEERWRLACLTLHSVPLGSITKTVIATITLLPVTPRHRGSVRGGVVRVGQAPRPIGSVEHPILSDHRRGNVAYQGCRGHASSARTVGNRRRRVAASPRRPGPRR